ncbi:MAG: hypothetical protein AAGD33_05630 [Actinomycetota bacterium]
MGRRHAALFAVAVIVLAGCSGSDDSAPGADRATTTIVDSTLPAPAEGFLHQTIVDDLSGLWVVVEVGGEAVDAASLGAYWDIRGSATSIAITGNDGCNQFGLEGAGGARVVFLVDGRLDASSVWSNSMGCSWDTIRVFPTTGSAFFLDAIGDELVVDPISEFDSSARFERVDEPPENLVAREVRAEATRRQAELEAAEEQAALERAEEQRVAAREWLQRELPFARERWAGRNFTDYVLTFEVVADRPHPSFPDGTPPSGMWQIDVTDGLASGPWGASELGDAVDDWFDFIEAEMTNRFITVDFHPDLGYPRFIASRPLDVVAGSPDDLPDWTISNVEVGAPRDPGSDAPEPGLVRLDDLEPLETGFWDPIEVDGENEAFLDSVYWTVTHDSATGLVSIGGFDGCNAWGTVSASGSSESPRLVEGMLSDVSWAGDGADCGDADGLLTSYPIEGSEFWYEPVTDRLVITPTTGGVSLGFRRLDELPVWTGDD